MIKKCLFCNTDLIGYFKVDTNYSSEILTCNNDNCKLFIKNCMYSKFNLEHRYYSNKYYNVWSCIISLQNNYYKICTNSMVNLTTYFIYDYVLQPFSSWKRLGEEDKYITLSENSIDVCKEIIKRKFTLKLFE